MTEGLDVFFWFENLHPIFGGQEIGHIFLGLKVLLNKSVEVFKSCVFLGG